MPKKPEILHTTLLGLHLRFANGQERHFERILGHGHGSVMIVPKNPEFHEARSIAALLFSRETISW
jgi:hypothetical protein